MPNGKTDNYENENDKEQKPYMNQDLMSEDEFNDIRDNFKKLREEIKPSHQKMYSKNKI